MLTSHGVNPRLVDLIDGHGSEFGVNTISIYTCFVSGYRPHQNSAGTGLVWSQHVRYYRGEGIQDPHLQNLFMEELTSAIQAWMQDGDHVVLGLDANVDVRHGSVQKELANIGMYESIIRHHPTKSVPATCNKNESRKLIDGI